MEEADSSNGIIPSDGSGFAREKNMVKPRANHAAEQRTRPVDTVVVPVTRDDRRSERHGRIHRRARIWGADNHSEEKRKSRREAAGTRERILRFGNRAEKNEDEEKCQQAFEQDALSARKACSEVGRSH